jgi:hypothetical protein
LERRFLLVILWVCAALLSACGAASGYADYAPTYAEAAPAAPMAKMVAGGEGAFVSDDLDLQNEPEELEAPPEPSKPEADQGGDKQPADGQGEVPVPQSRLVIYRADLGLFVFDVEGTLKKAVAICDKYKGWIQQSTSESVTLRIPAESFEGVMAELDPLGDLNFRNVVGTDVTEQFYDTQIRLKNAEILRVRYIDLLKQARTVEDSLAIERELARVTEEIELLKGRLRFLKDQIAFSTITLHLQRKTQEPVSTTRVPLPFDWMGEYNIDGALR